MLWASVELLDIKLESSHQKCAIGQKQQEQEQEQNRECIVPGNPFWDRAGERAVNLIANAPKVDFYVFCSAVKKRGVSFSPSRTKMSWKAAFSLVLQMLLDRAMSCSSPNQHTQQQQAWALQSNSVTKVMLCLL